MSERIPNNERARRLQQVADFIDKGKNTVLEKFKTVYVNETGLKGESLRENPLQYKGQLESLLQEVETFRKKIDELLGEDLVKYIDEHEDPDGDALLAPFFRAMNQIPSTHDIRRKILSLRVK